MRFAVQILFFDCDQFILRTIENCAPYVEKIFITYSPEPWSAYNLDARKNYKNPSNPLIINKSKYFEKIEIITGVWDTEEAQRNECLQIAKLQGFDYLIIQDADEFYLPEEFKENLKGIINNPDFDYYRNPWYFFWKDLETIIVSRYSISNGSYKPYKKTIVAYNACFCINLRRNVAFHDKRLPTSKSYFMLQGLCYHLSYVLSDEQLLRKLKTWGHSSDFDTELWFQNKWLPWQKSSKYLHPITSVQWVGTSIFSGRLPKELMGFNPGLQSHRKTGVFKSVLITSKDILVFAKVILYDIIYLFRHKLLSKIR